mmetsp:Transcript_12129/g.48839  ORF Transcript_12129/g.48839 Transcript_12129/m.48839 type:complete len:267 (-) Transcript_12129:354-1154(-)
MYVAKTHTQHSRDPARPRRSEVVLEVGRPGRGGGAALRLDEEARVEREPQVVGEVLGRRVDESHVKQHDVARLVIHRVPLEVRPLLVEERLRQRRVLVAAWVGVRSERRLASIVVHPVSPGPALVVDLGVRLAQDGEAALDVGFDILERDPGRPKHGRVVGVVRRGQRRERGAQRIVGFGAREMVRVGVLDSLLAGTLDAQPRPERIESDGRIQPPSSDLATAREGAQRRLERLGHLRERRPRRDLAPLVGRARRRGGCSSSFFRG